MLKKRLIVYGIRQIQLQKNRTPKRPENSSQSTNAKIPTIVEIIISTLSNVQSYILGVD